MKSLPIIGVVLLCLLFTACGMDKSAVSGASHGQAHLPTLEVDLQINGNTAVAKVTTDLHISPEHYGGARKEGEGHIHMYLDDGEKIGVKQDTHEFTKLAKGEHTLKVSLHNNDHTPYDVTQVIEFEIK